MNNFIIYGAGNKGKRIYEFLKYLGHSDEVYAFCDRNAENINMVDDKKVFTFNELCDEELPYFVSVSDISFVTKLLNDNSKSVIGSTVNDLASYLGMDRVALNREYCAFFHIDHMDDYFERAENALNTFWDDNSPFYKVFQKLDLDNVIELACGRGRHVPMYVDKARHITLVDILDKNIEFCKNRFSDYSKISYYKNDGFNLRELKSGQYTALFTYDSMVHFEMLDIYSYLIDIYRVLENGGYALFHHSNMHSDYKMSFENAGNPGARNYMSKDLFAYMAYRAGFEIIEQRIFDWSLPEMDCITLVRKAL